MVWMASRHAKSPKERGGKGWNHCLLDGFLTVGSEWLDLFFGFEVSELKVDLPVVAPMVNQGKDGSVFASKVPKWNWQCSGEVSDPSYVASGSDPGHFDLVFFDTLGLSAHFSFVRPSPFLLLLEEAFVDVGAF